MKYEVISPDYIKSPYTGMTKQHWLDVCEFLLEGIFKHITSMDSPVLVPRQEFDISYPNENTEKWKLYAQKFEGLARSFLIAAPLLYNRPDAKICGYSIREYYKKQILSSVNPESPNYLFSIPELKDMSKNGEDIFQHTCECASLAIGLDMCREVIWNTYTKDEKDRIAEYLICFGNGKTSAHNWRLFNMLILGFLHMEGYGVDKDCIRDHAQTILSYYAGDGWYRDGHRFDYYTPWAFQVYGPIWNSWYGYQNEPYIASKIEQYSNDLMLTFPNMFDKAAHMTLWGRSCIYRSAATAPFAANFLLRNPNADPGLSRRIVSGTLLQFITREDVFYEGVPSLGFYSLFPPMLQDYSCAESPFWIANSFLCLCFPDNHPFWTATENNGAWDSLDEKHSKVEVLNGPGIVTALHGENGAAEFRTGKLLFKKNDDYIKNYLRLSFHSQFAWEDFDYQGVEAMQYSLKYDSNEKAQVPNILLYSGQRNGILYRKEYFDFDYTFQDRDSIDLADYALPDGMLRIDKMRIHKGSFRLTLGAYGFPIDGQVSVERRKKSNAEAVIIKGPEKQLAMVTYAGFESLKTKTRSGVNAISQESMLIYGECFRKKYYEYAPYVMVSAILSKDSSEDWTDDELFPISELKFEDIQQCGGYGKVFISLKNGEELIVDYEAMEGCLSL